MSKACKIVPVKNRLGQLLRRSGGVSRTEAVQAASAAVETLREDYVGAIPQELAALEAIAAAARRKRISPHDLEAMIEHAGRLLTLAGTFGFGLLEQVVQRFCDLGVGMLEKGIDDAEAVDVHLRAMRLVCPGAPGLSEQEAEKMLRGLSKVHAHYHIRCLEPGAVRADA